MTALPLPCKILTTTLVTFTSLNRKGKLDHLWISVKLDHH